MLLAAGFSFAQPAPTLPQIPVKQGSDLAAGRQAGAKPRMAVPAPQQSPSPATPTLLAIKTGAAALDSAVAGTCTVIDALVADYCSQAPNDDNCKH